MLARPLRCLVRRSLGLSYFHNNTALWASQRVAQTFKLADIGEGITECEIIKWNVKPHANVQAFDPLCEVQSDKASVEITSPYDGVVKELLVNEGEVAKVGSGLCVIEIEREEEEDAGGNVNSSEPLQEKEKQFASDEETARRFHPLDPKNNKESRTDANILASPSVRHFARQKGVDLGLLVPGSGKDGRIEKTDVEAYLGQEYSQTRTEEDVVVELGRTRYGMWKAMVKSLEIPHFGYSTTLDITALHHILPILNAHIPRHHLPIAAAAAPPSSQFVNPSAIFPAPEPTPIPESQKYTRLTYLPILLKTLSKAMLEWPVFRSSITPLTDTSHKPTLTIRPNADISIALSTATGLYTPTLQAVNTQSIYSLSSQLKHLSHLGRQTPCGLSPKEMPKRGGTITVSNIGAIGQGDFASPVLVPGGGVAIVAIGHAKWIWDVDSSNRGGDRKGGERRLKVGVSWSGDHRVVEGAELAAFVESWRSYVEAPERLIGEGI